MEQVGSESHEPILGTTELLALASDHEHREMNCNRHMAFCFLPFGLGISHLMAALGAVCEQHFNEFKLFAQRLDLSADYKARNYLMTHRQITSGSSPTMA
ncbi:hypothetical protein L861_13930 [Litchfieldella anticariensis FP35 = DSM 16096]|uniref:Uncharacterized protein n=1 Tax=Litchfieldella anticariensis (strain DSM 16096 / CECT 5854 / CIP 108499 / LMG 22089 / FP35) TaxID=1121939 RepID=S2KJ44_LITA3|nr:hypothetical protein [Halomonas anticariensis]EPC00368.1 hypothetical protein L861_13930 [Halomonas anticariensis FP35 = DSM 16096]